MNPETLFQLVKNHIWYQRFTLPNGVVIGQMECAEKWRRMQMPADFNDQSVLDLGCDMGWYCFQAKRQGAGQVYGVDIDKKSIEGAETLRDEVYGLKDVEFRVGNIEELDLNRTFDYVFLLSTLHRIKKTQPPFFAPILDQLIVLENTAKWVNKTFVLEYKPEGNKQKQFLETLYSIVEDLGPSISPDQYERRILKCHMH